MHRTIQLRLKPTAKQRDELTRILSYSCDLYNAALQERRDAWRIAGKSIRYQDQQKELTELNQEIGLDGIAVDIAREPLRRVDRAFKAFFRRIRDGQTPGYPRFRSKERYDSFTFNRPHIQDRILMVPNFGGLRFKSRRNIPGDFQTATIIRTGQKWAARIVCDIGPAPDKVAVSRAVGIDLGLTHFITLSDGAAVENPRWTKQHEDRIAKANQALSRKSKGSRNRAHAREVLRRAHQRAADARRNFTHHVSKWLVSNYDLIAFEKLNIKGMVRSNLAKSILDAAWGELIWKVSYKAESAGRWAVPVNPRSTTINCSGCGEKVPKTLGQRTHTCPSCGLILGRDHNAAINVLALGMSAAGKATAKRVPELGI